MARSVVRQPDGKWAMWSSIIDDFVLTDATEDELVEWAAKEAYEQQEAAMREIIERSKSGKGHRGAWMSWEEAMEKTSEEEASVVERE